MRVPVAVPCHAVCSTIKNYCIIMFIIIIIIRFR